MEARPDPLAGAARVLVVSAHPHDETLGAGRLIAGHEGPVVALTLTAGENCLVGRDVDTVDVAMLRLAEWRSAAAELGADTLDTPRWVDGTLDVHEVDVARLLLRTLQPGDVLLAPWSRDPDADHRAAGRAAREAGDAAGVTVVEYPVWAPYFRTPHQVQETGQQLVPVESGVEAARSWRRARHTRRGVPPGLGRPLWSLRWAASPARRRPAQYGGRRSGSVRVGDPHPVGEEPVGGAPEHRLRAARDADLAVAGADVGLDRVDRQRRPRRDVDVAHALGDQRQHLRLAGGEALLAAGPVAADDGRTAACGVRGDHGLAAGDLLES